jgi:hypothetical protein
MKKALLIVRSAFQYRTFIDGKNSELIFPALLRAGVGTLLRPKAKAGCQGVIGPYPSTFLNK